VGNQISITDPMARVTTFEYDNRNRKIARHVPGGRTTRWAYDAVGNVTQVTNPDGTTTRKTYDAMNRVRTATDEMGHAVAYTYTALGNVETITDRKGYKYKYEYDIFGGKQRLWYPAANGTGYGSCETWCRNYDGNVMIYINRAGQVLDYEYDSRRRETKREWRGNPGSAVRTAFDAAGRVVSRENALGLVAYGYDPAGRMTNEYQEHWAMADMYEFHYDYDADGRRVGAFDPIFSKQTSYTYTARGEIENIAVHEVWSGQCDRWISYAYNAAGQRVERAYANGTADLYGYDAAGRLSSIRTVRDSDGASILRQDFGYDLRNRRTWSMRDNGHGETYAYQADSQLTGFRAEVWRPDLHPGATGDINHAFAYDPNGNRTTRYENEYPVTTYNTNALNEYTAVGGASVAHNDGRGNLTQWKDWSYAYDPENRLVSATGPGHAYAFAYDAEGRLGKITHNGEIEYRYYQGSRLVARCTSHPYTSEELTWGATADELVATGSNYYHHDPLNNAAVLTDHDTGDVTECYKFDAFGNARVFDAAWQPRAGGATGNRWLFTGQEYLADLGLYNFKNRFYHPDLGRFIQQDPIRFDAGDLNLYRYCFNNPSNLVDPLGLESSNGYRRDDYEKTLRIIEENKGADVASDSGANTRTLAGTSPVAGAGGPGGTVQPGTATTAQNCAGRSIGVNQWVNWPNLGRNGDWSKAITFVPQGWTKLDNSSATLTTTAANPGEREAIVFIYRWVTGVPAGSHPPAAEYQSDFHMVGRDTVNAGGWESKMDRRENVNLITDPLQSLYDAYPHTLSPSHQIIRETFSVDPSKTVIINGTLQ
jgi:RHS repeat-associated protein